MLRPPVGGSLRERYLPLTCLIGGTTLGGALLGSALVIPSLALSSLHAVRTGLVFGVAGLSAAALGWPSLRRWLPERGCQVPVSRLRRGSLGQAAFHWGVELGLGLCTFAVTPALYAMLALAIGQKHPVGAALVCMLYGASRGATIARFAIAYSHRVETRVFPGTGLERSLRGPLLVAITAATAVRLI